MKQPHEIGSKVQIKSTVHPWSGKRKYVRNVGTIISVKEVAHSHNTPHGLVYIVSLRQGTLQEQFFGKDLKILLDNPEETG